MAKSKQTISTAQKLYEAYGDHADWKNFQGNAMPAWKDLTDAVRGHWQAVADATEPAPPPEPPNLTDQFDDRELERIRRSLEYVDAKAVTNASADGKAALIAKMARLLNIE